MAALRAAKQALRREIKARVAAVSDQEKLRQSRVVSQKVNITDLSHCASDNIEMEGVSDHCKSTKTWPYFPRSSRMDMLRLKDTEELADEDSYREEALTSGGLDLILMPGLGFDKKGNRLGRGKGFYDTYLERCSTHPKGKPYTIALAFKEQLCAEVPVGEHDILIDEVLYEDEE
uniref:5-formyltetrahydrofolate cyclo-ligase n=1 Tax=Cyprinus carpio TaxID=7962 RepID=A0A8C2JAD4_CYPCA